LVRRLVVRNIVPVDLAHSTWHHAMTQGANSAHRIVVVSMVAVLVHRLVVQNINIIKRHTKPNPQAGQAGGIVEREAPIHISNVMLVGDDGKATRIGARKDEQGKNVRISRRTGKDL